MSRSRHSAALSCRGHRPCNERIKLNRGCCGGTAWSLRFMPAAGWRLARGHEMMWCLMSSSIDIVARGHVTFGHVTYVSRETARITNWIRYLRRRLQYRCEGSFRRHRHPAVDILWPDVIYGHMLFAGGYSFYVIPVSVFISSRLRKCSSYAKHSRHRRRTNEVST